MNKFGTTRARSLMTCASIVALCAVLPGRASAQSTDTGAAGQALTTGTITSSTGNVVDGGTNGAVNASGPSTLITVDNATINNTTANDPGLNVFSTSSSGGAGVSAVFTGTNNIAGLLGAVTVSGVNEAATIDATAGGGTYAGGLNANSQAGSATILNANNILTGSTTQAALTVTAGSTGTTAMVASTGGSIVSGYGISANALGGDIVVGPNGGVSTAMTLTNPAGIGIAASDSGSGNVTITTGAGGTIDGGAWGVYANNGGGAGTINVTVGDTIGANSAPSASAIDVRSGSGSVTITATASLASGSNTVFSYVNGGAGDLTATTAGVASTNGSGVDLNIYGASSTGTLSYTLTGANAVSGGNAVWASNAGSGDVNIQASDAGSSITGHNGAGVVAEASGTGAVTVNVAGSVSGTTNAVYTTATSGATSITVGGPLSSGGTGVNATSTGGAISVAAASTINSTSASGIYVNSVGQAGTTGGGAVSVGSADQRVSGVTGGHGNGIFAAGAGDVTIYAGTVTGGTRGVLAASQSNGTSDGKVLIDVNGQVTAKGSYGVLGVNTGVLASDTLTINTAGVTSTGGSGISAQSGFGDISITATGPITANAGNGSGWDGIYAGTVYSVASGDPFNSDLNVTIKASGAITGSYDGVTVDLTGASTKGAITVNATGPISGAYNGVDATSTGAGAIKLGTLAAPLGAVTAGNGTGVFASGAGEVDVYTGAVTATGGTVATRLYNSSTGANNGAATGVTLGQGFGVAAISTGGNVVVNASGQVTGGADGGVLAQALGSGSVSITTAGVTANASTGIEADSAGGDITVAANGAVSGATYGVYVTNSGVDSAGSVTVTTGSTVTSGANYGVNVQSLGFGAVSVGTSTQRLGGLVSGATTGILATGEGDIKVYASDVTGGTRGIVASSQPATDSGTSNGAVTIDVSGAVTAGNGAGVIGVNNGVLAANTLTINVSQVTATGGSAISAQSAAGDIAITASGPIRANSGNGYSWDGIYAATTQPGSDLNIAINTSGSVSGSWNGIEADTSTASSKGAITVNATGAITAAHYGVLAAGAGAGTITVATSGDVTAATGGISASNTGAGAVNIGGANGIGGVITTTGVGISGATNTGALTITTAAGGSIAPGAAIGIQAISASGPITVTQGGDIGAAGAGGAVGLGVDAEIQSASATSDINIASTGGIYVAAGTGLQSAGIYAVNSGSGAVNVTTSGVIDPGAYGVVATSTGAGSTTVTTKGSIVASSAGLNLTAGTGGLNLTLGGSVTATAGPAVLATSASSATINISSGAVVSGVITSPTQGVITLATASGQSSTINIASGAVVGVAAGSTSDIAIRATGGSVVVNNNGEIEGLVDFSALTGSNTGTLNQAPGTLFVTSGTSNFGSGNANFANGGTLQTQGQTTTFVFGGANNVFTNAGTIIVGGNPPANGARAAGVKAGAAAPTTSTFVLTNLTNFANSGALQMINGVAGDSIVAKGSNYVGSGAAKLAVDTVIGAPGSASDTLVVGTSSGRTTVQIHDAAGTGSFGAYNPTGTVIVQGQTHKGDFTLDAASSWYNANLFGGALDKPGFFFSQLGVDPSGNTVLISAPKLQAYQFAALPTQAQTVWYDTTPQPERQGELRDQLAKGGTGDGRPTAWVKVEGSTAQRDVNQPWSGAGNSYSYDAGYTQDIQTETAGVDGMRRTAEGMGLAYGMSAGYVQSNAHFDRASTRAEMSGWTLNGYATVTQKDVFAAFAIGGDGLTAKLTAPQMTGFAPSSVGVNSRGATFETGVRKPFLFGSTIEPSVGLAYVHTTVGELKTAGADFHFDQAQSVRASFGTRVTGDVDGLGGGSWRTRYEVSLRGVDDLQGNNTSSLGSLGPALPLTDNFQKAFGEARIGLTSRSQGGWSASADLRERFNRASSDTGLSLAVRYQF